ncbi:hypothetical protein STEG23_030392 [Scotinomys teguina]
MGKQVPYGEWHTGNICEERQASEKSMKDEKKMCPEDNLQSSPVRQRKEISLKLKKKMRTCRLLPGWYGLTSQDLLTALQMFQNPDQLQDNWLKDEASQTAPVKTGPSS